eukprot:scaffold117995_cov32-Tisochrysis_lutea.AAC.8
MSTPKRTDRVKADNKFRHTSIIWRRRGRVLTPPGYEKEAAPPAGLCVEEPPGVKLYADEDEAMRHPDPGTGRRPHRAPPAGLCVDRGAARCEAVGRRGCGGTTRSVRRGGGGGTTRAAPTR